MEYGGFGGIQGFDVYYCLVEFVYCYGVGYDWIDFKSGIEQFFVGVYDVYFSGLEIVSFFVVVIQQDVVWCIGCGGLVGCFIGQWVIGVIRGMCDVYWLVIVCQELCGGGSCMVVELVYDWMVSRF